MLSKETLWTREDSSTRGCRKGLEFIPHHRLELGSDNLDLAIVLYP